MSRLHVAVAAAVWAVLVVSLGLAEAAPQAIALAGIVAAGSAAVVTVADMTAAPAAVARNRRSRRSRGVGSDAQTVALRRQVRSTRVLGSTELHDTLVALVDDRLVAHHGIDRSTDPAEAERVLDPVLRRLVSSGRSRSIPVRELRRIVEAIEEL